MSEQTEDFATGRASVEQAQGFSEMPPPVPEPAANDGPVALDEVVASRPAVEAPVVPREYHTIRNGEVLDELRPDRESISSDRAVKDLAAARAAEFEAHEALRQQQLKEQLDNLRSPLAAEIEKVTGGQSPVTQAHFDAMTVEQQNAWLAQQQAAFDAAQQQQSQAQPEAQPTADQDLSKILQDNPRLMEAIQQQRQQDWSQANQTVAAAEQFVLDNGKSAMAALLYHNPELRGLTDWRQLPQAVDIIARTNPERAKAIINEVQGIQAIVAQAENVQMQQAQRDAQRYVNEWNKFSNDEDAKFIQSHPEFADPQKSSEIAQHSRSYLNSIGLTDADIGRLWNGHNSISLRDHRVQSVLLDAVRYRQAMAAVPNARVNTPVRVQRPGSPVERAPQEDVDMRALSNRLNGARGIEAARLGAQMIAERRARGRR